MGAETPLINHAQAFLKLLDPATERFSFRTFPDNSEVADLAVTGKVQGCIIDVADQLDGRNARGAGIFVAINEGGQKKADITRVRAVFADTDGADLEPIVTAFPPHIVVNTSPGKWHVYWLVAEGFPLDQFRSVQRAIAEKFGTDPDVSDLSRVMRLPGFYHNKAEPYLATILDWDARLPRYRFDEITAGLGLNLTPVVIPVDQTTSHQSTVWRNVLTGEYTKPEIEEMLRYINPFSRRKEWMDILFVLAFELGEDGRELADRWSRGDLWIGESQCP